MALDRKMVSAEFEHEYIAELAKQVLLQFASNNFAAAGGAHGTARWLQFSEPSNAATGARRWAESLFDELYVVGEERGDG